MKRFLDILASLAALAVFFPIGLVVSAILRLTGEGEVFYVHPRIGKDGKPFGLIKFATMLRDSPNLGTGDITVQNDPRVLPFGHFLRRTKTNELPQIINILKGDMSIIGPRPLTVKNFDYYSDTVKEVICRMRPGLSGVGSVVFRDEETMMANSGMPCQDFYAQYVAPYKGELEIWYQQNSSLRVDAVLVLLTAWAIIFPKSDLPFRIFKSLPPRPDFLTDDRYRKASEDLTRVCDEDAPGILEIKPASRKSGQSKVLR